MSDVQTKMRGERLSRDKPVQSATKPNQRSTKYSQKFLTESAAVQKQSKLQHTADTVEEKLEKARGKAAKIGGKQAPSNGFGQQIKQAGAAAVRGKVSESEGDNIGTESAHKLEFAAERTYGAGKNAARSAARYIRDRPLRQAARLEDKSARANAKLEFHKTVKDNPKSKGNLLSRHMQKRRIKRKYAKVAREAKHGYHKAKQAGKATAKITKAVVRLASNPKVWLLVGILALLFFIVSSCMSSMSFLMGGANHILASTYLASEEDITEASVLYSEWETDLQIRIDNAETEHPGYDEYRYNIGYIGHDRFAFMAYLTAVYGAFDVTNITPDLQRLFNEQYNISYAETTETRYRTETITVTDPTTGATTTETRQVAYEWRVLTVTLTARGFTNVALSRMNAEQAAVYNQNIESRGNRQFYGSPIAGNWLSLVTSHFGYRIHPIFGGKSFHSGIDLALPTGTNLLAVHGGTVTTGNDPDGYGIYVVVENSDGLKSLYAHCDSLLVTDGQTVNQGDVIAKSSNTGSSTGPHLHLETLLNGVLLNPIYFLDS